MNLGIIKLSKAFSEKEIANIKKILREGSIDVLTKVKGDLYNSNQINTFKCSEDDLRNYNIFLCNGKKHFRERQSGELIPTYEIIFEKIKKVIVHSEYQASFDEYETKIKEVRELIN